MSLNKSKCWYSNNCLHFLKCAVPLAFFCSKIIYETDHKTAGNSSSLHGLTTRHKIVSLLHVDHSIHIERANMHDLVHCTHLVISPGLNIS
jgi:hypothetical protein